MSDDELKEMLARNQEQLKERIADEKLQQAQELLNEIAKKFPKSKAAKQAGQMLEVLKKSPQPSPFTAPARNDL